MEETITLSTTPAQIEQELAELAPLNVIRTETVLSRLPIHNLSKKGTVNIKIEQKDSRGKLTLLWKVSPSRDYGEPRQLAYKLDTIVVNRKLEAAGRPLPPMIRLGSLREVAHELGLGSDTAKVRKALLQNASAFITAKLSYTARDKSSRRLETGFTRYSVVFTGEQLPDGSAANAVYLIPNDPYREVLNNAPVQPLDYDYLRKLTPAAQRFYEILSRKIFAAIKNKRVAAKLTYSEYCTYSAQRRYYARQPVQNQMSAIHRAHKKFGYIADARYAATVDAENNPDWEIYYTPGPKARAEYQTFNKAGRIPDAPLEQAGDDLPATLRRLRKPRSLAPRQTHLRFNQPAEPSTIPEADPQLVAELGQWGIGETAARKLLSALPNTQPVRDQIDYAVVQISKGKIEDPPAFIVSTLKKNEALPPTFETRARREEREEAQRQRERERQEENQLRDAYDDYRRRESERYMAEELTAEARDKLTRIEFDACRRKYPNLPKQTMEQIVSRAVRDRVAQHMTFLTLEEFRERERQQPQPGQPATAEA